MRLANYRYSLALTSQFYYCGLPLRLDSYSRCHFNCVYCFASARGGFRGNRRLKAANADALRRRLEKLRTTSPNSVVDEFLARKQPIHLGGVSDPFIQLDAESKITLGLLRVLADHQYPTVISTKGDLFQRSEYLEVLKRGKCIVQISVSSMDSSLAAMVNVGTPEPSALVHAAKLLSAEGVPVACRIQPLLPTREPDALEVVDAVASAGVRHVAVEYLKLPVETSWWGTSRLSKSLGVNLHDYYSHRDARRVGREWILPPQYRLEWIMRLRERVHSRGLSFGAADNDLLLLSDGDCCCSGIDLFEGFQEFYRFNYVEAIRSGEATNQVTISALDRIWHPKRSISQYINSHSRIHDSQPQGTGIRRYIEHNWNGSLNGNSPEALFGVADTGESDDRGFRIYALSDEVRFLLRQRLHGSTRR